MLKGKVSSLPAATPQATGGLIECVHVVSKGTPSAPSKRASLASVIVSGVHAQTMLTWAQHVC